MTKQMIKWDDATPEQQLMRWENVVRVLGALTPHERKKHWNMQSWGQKTECGTVACAAGHCGLDSWFRRRGFRLNFIYDGESWDTNLAEDDNLVMDFFGYDGPRQIFYNGDRRSVSTVIKEVKAYIKDLKLEHKFQEENLE